MIKTIMVDTNSRLVVSIIETIAAVYSVGNIYGTSVVADASLLPDTVSDEALYNLWHYTTNNEWVEHVPIPGTFYKWNPATSVWVSTPPSPILTLTSSLKFKETRVDWVIADTNWGNYYFNVQISKTADFAVLESFAVFNSAENYFISTDIDSISRTYYMRTYWVDEANVTQYGPVANTGSLTPSLVISSTTNSTTNTVTEVFRLDGTGLDSYPKRSVVNSYGGTYNNPVIQEGTVTLQSATTGTITQYVPLQFFGYGSFKLVVNAIGYAERVGYSTNNYSLSASCTAELQIYFENPSEQPDLADILPGTLVGMGSVVLASDHSDTTNTLFLGRIIGSYPSFCSIMFNSGSTAITDPLGNTIEPKTPYLKLTSRRSQSSTAVTYIRYIVSGVDDGHYIAFPNNYGI